MDLETGQAANLPAPMDAGRPSAFPAVTRAITGRIRRATREDISALTEIAREFHGITLYGQFGVAFSADKMAATLEAHIASADACVLVADLDGVIAGVAGALITQPYMSDDSMAVELYWWVNPTARGRSLAMALMNATEDWARARGCRALVMSSVATQQGSPADSIYERRGYQIIEKSWVKEI